VLVGAGDIASCGYDTDERTAQLLDGIPGTVFTAGDDAYPDGTYEQFMNCYDPTWGRHKARTKPVPGNHDYNTAEGAAYYQYFNNVPPYYVYTLGTWRIYALNSEIDVSAASAQIDWLKKDLMANPTQCVLAYWHRPRWSSGGEHGSDPAMQTLWQIFHDAGAELIINGHDHNYERFAEMDDTGTAVPQGLREFVVGTGGAGLYDFGPALPSTEVRNNTTFGVLKLTLHPTSYEWEFVPLRGSSFTDSGSGACR
jgi:3',5'-cyclic AMP phosphodiesterase CpdA